MRKASLIAVHAWHTPLAAISRAGSPSRVPDLAATAAEAARRLAGLLDSWRKKHPRHAGQPVCRARPPGPRAGRLVHPHRPGGHRQARQPTRPARPRLSQARRPEPRARPRRGDPVALTWPGGHGKPGQTDQETRPHRRPGWSSPSRYARRPDPGSMSLPYRGRHPGSTGTASWKRRGAWPHKGHAHGPGRLGIGALAIPPRPSERMQWHGP